MLNLSHPGLAGALVGLALGLVEYFLAMTMIRRFVAREIAVARRDNEPLPGLESMPSTMRMLRLIVPALALLAPVLGQNSDRTGRTVTHLRFLTYALVAVSAALFFVHPRPGDLWLGLALLGLGSIIAEVGATSMKEMGKVMGVVSKKLAGMADGKDISAKVKELLS